MKQSIFGKNKDHMSYSAYKMWKTSKEAYRKHYYEGEKSFETVETKFGHMVHELIEHGDASMKHVPHYQIFEYPIEVMIEGNRVIGRLDTFDDGKIRFSDFKTGHSPWDKVKVRKLEQLPFYSMMLKEIYGKVDSSCTLIWIETTFKVKNVEFDGHILESQSRELILTGKVKKFRRIISKYERKRIKIDLINVCEEIKKDYQLYLKTKNEKTNP